MFLFYVWDSDASSIAFIIAIVPGIGVRFPASFAVVLHDVNSNLTFHISWVLLYPHSFFFRHNIVKFSFTSTKFYVFVDDG